jgi:hypothetical protein
MIDALKVRGGRSMPVPPMDLTVNDHLRLIVAGPVEIVDRSRGIAHFRIVDWVLDPTCRHCGGPI